MKHLADELQKLANAPQDAASREQRARAMRKAAEDMLRNSTPEQRREAEKWAREHPAELDAARKELEKAGVLPKGGGGGDDKGASGLGGPGSEEGEGGHRAERGPASGATHTEPVDARRAPEQKPTRERIIAEWYADKKPGDGQPVAGTLSPGAEESVREAVRSGERAVDDQTVPSRFDNLLLRYFRRLPDRAKAGPPAGTPPQAPAAPAQPAKDAP